MGLLLLLLFLPPPRLLPSVSGTTYSLYGKEEEEEKEEEGPFFSPLPSSLFETDLRLSLPREEKGNEEKAKRKQRFASPHFSLFAVGLV